MEPARYKCCRCGSSLQAVEPERPWPCGHGCGEWFTREAVDALLIPRMMTPIATAPPGDAPRCLVCDTAMRTLLAEPFFLCAEHGVWFDTDARQAFERVLSAEIAKQRESRNRDDAAVDALATGDRG